MIIETERLEFMRTSDGKIGIGISNPNGGEAGGFKMLKWCPASLLVDVEKKLLVDEIKRTLEAL